MTTAINFNLRGGDAGIVEIDTRKQKQLTLDFDEQLEFRKKNRLELGRIARELKTLYLTRGQREKGKGWEQFLADRELNDRTVDRWIEGYELTKGLRGSKTVRDILSRTNVESKGDSAAPDRTPHHSEPSQKNDWPELRPEPEANEPAIAKFNALDTPQGRSDWLFKQALDVFERANKASGQALREWDEAAARVRKVLASYKNDEIDKPNAFFSAIGQEEE